MTIQRALRFTGLICMLTLPARGLAAQSAPPRAMDAASTDSAAWQSVFIHVIGQLSPQLVRTGFDSLAQPWRIQIAAGEPLRSTFERQLRTLLRARTPVSDAAIADLEAKQDVTITTERTHVLGYLCKQLTALENGGSLQDVVIWRWLCEHAWPAHLDDDQRRELARDVVRIADVGTVEHVVEYLRNMLPPTVSPTPAAVAPELIDILARSRTGSGAV